jgi:hypothetical protein
MVAIDNPQSTVTHDGCQENTCRVNIRRGAVETWSRVAGPRILSFSREGGLGYGAAVGVPSGLVAGAGAGVFVGGAGVGVGGSFGFPTRRSMSVTN